MSNQLDEISFVEHNLRSLADVRMSIPTEGFVCLNLYGNHLENLNGLPKADSIAKIVLSSNKIYSPVLMELSFLPSLMILDLSANNLTTLQGLPFLPCLRKLVVAYNRIVTLNGLDNATPNLEILDLRCNLIARRQDLDPIYGLINLTELLLGGKHPNPICLNVSAIVSIFRYCSRLDLIDGREMNEWKAQEITMVSTPTYDRVAQRYRQRLAATTKPNLADDSFDTVVGDEEGSPQRPGLPPSDMMVSDATRTPEKANKTPSARKPSSKNPWNLGKTSSAPDGGMSSRNPSALPPLPVDREVLAVPETATVGTSTSNMPALARALAVVLSLAAGRIRRFELQRAMSKLKANCTAVGRQEDQRRIAEAHKARDAALSSWEAEAMALKGLVAGLERQRDAAVISGREKEVVYLQKEQLAAQQLQLLQDQTSALQSRCSDMQSLLDGQRQVSEGLSSQLDAATAAKLELQRERDLLEKSLLDTAQMLDDAKAENSQLLRSISESNAAVERSSAAHKDLELGCMRAQLESERRQNDAAKLPGLEKELRDAEEARDIYRQKCESQGEQCRRLEAANAELSRDSEHWKIQLKDVKKKLERTVGEAKQLLEGKKKAEEMAAKCRQDAVSMAKMFRDLQEVVEQKQERCKNCKEKEGAMAHATCKFDEVNDRYIVLHKKHEDLQSAYNDLHGKFSELLSVQRKAQESISTLEAEKRSARQDIEYKLALREKQVEDQLKAIEQEKQRRVAVEAELKELLREHDELVDRYRAKKEEIADLKEELLHKEDQEQEIREMIRRQVARKLHREEGGEHDLRVDFVDHPTLDGDDPQQELLAKLDDIDIAEGLEKAMRRMVRATVKGRPPLK